MLPRISCTISRALSLCAWESSIGLIRAAVMLAGPDVSAAPQADLMLFTAAIPSKREGEQSFIDSVETLGGLCATCVALANVNSHIWVRDSLLALDVGVQKWAHFPNVLIKFGWVSLHALLYSPPSGQANDCCSPWRLTCIWLLFLLPEVKILLRQSSSLSLNGTIIPHCARVCKMMFNAFLCRRKCTRSNGLDM